MSAAHDRPDDPSEAPFSGASRRRRRELSQLEFELDFLGRVLERDPLYGDALKVHADNLAAKGYHNRALQADLQLVRLRPDKPIAWYNLACSYAVLGMIERAFEALERSLRLGYRHFHHLRRDPDLKSLRRDPRFARLLRRH
jgi:tetratricopeptide (TPR) repeat protein